VPPVPRFRLRTESTVPRHKRHGYDRRGRRLKGFTQRMLARLLPKKRHKRPDYSRRSPAALARVRRRRRPLRRRLRRARRLWRRLATLWRGLEPLRRRLSRRRLRLRRESRRESPLLRRTLGRRPRIQYAVREIRVLQRQELEETLELLHEHPGDRYLLVERRMGRVGYGPLLADAFGLLTPALRLRSQQVGHKSARRIVYTLQSGVSLELRRRLLFGWLRNLVNKNDAFNRLRRNPIKKPSKRIRLKPERGRRLIHSFRPRLGCEFRRLVEGDEPVLELLEDFLDKAGHQKPTPVAHYRWQA
jgi:hypothetical protein